MCTQYEPGQAPVAPETEQSHHYYSGKTLASLGPSSVFKPETFFMVSESPIYRNVRENSLVPTLMSTLGANRWENGLSLSHHHLLLLRTGKN